MLTQILYAVLVLGILGFIFGIILSYASIKFKVEIDPRTIRRNINLLKEKFDYDIVTWQDNRKGYYLLSNPDIDFEPGEIRAIIDNPMLLVLNKKDALPKSVKEEKILEYIDSLELDYIDKIVISANKNYNIDLLMRKIMNFF